MSKNNVAEGFVAMEMLASGYHETGVDLDNPNFADMAKGAGLFARRVEDPAHLADAMREILSHDGPALLDVVIPPHELAMPPTIDAAEVKGFGLWTVRAVLNGRGRELVDVARTNLFR